MQAYWYYKGQYFPMNDELFHFTFILLNYKEFGYDDVWLKDILEAYDFSYEDFKDAPEANCDWFANMYFANDTEEGDAPVCDMAEEILENTHSKGAIRVRPTCSLTYITCSTLKNKKVVDNIIAMVMDDDDLHKNGMKFCVEQACDGDWSHDLHAVGYTDLINKLVEN